MSNKNPYSQAADAYGNTAAETDQRALEGKILLKSARQLEELAKRLAAAEKIPLEDIGDTIEYNRKLWMVFVNDAMNDAHPLPQEIKNNIASLGVFVFKRSTEILVETTPEKIQVLIDINRNIAAGLMKQNAQAKPASGNENPPAPPSEPTDPIIA
ncbi:MAG: flagellar biosynthesis regulator FlaF [Bdellovibrionales bacterium]|jgi:flagellar protein FlaF|nr:flagellar biosynthesis regulator FlaF [Bdellovibrionales bacterium]